MHMKKHANYNYTSFIEIELDFEKCKTIYYSWKLFTPHDLLGLGQHSINTKDEDISDLYC